MQAGEVDADAIVVGAAIGGGAVGCALGLRGVRTVLVEKVSRSVHSTRGDLLHPPTLRLLDTWGALAGLHAEGAVLVTEVAVSAARGEPIARFHVAPSGEGLASRTIAVPHDRIEAVLLQAALRWPNVRQVTGQVVGLVQDAQGRACGIRVRRPDQPEEQVLRTRVVVGCDGSGSLVRGALGIAAQPQPYEHEEVIIAGTGEPRLPHAMHWYVDDLGGVGVVARPRQAVRLIMSLPAAAHVPLFQQPDPALRDAIAARFPELGRLDFRKRDAHVYRLSRHLAERFWAPGAALVGDAAHATHPAGATGMSLATNGAERLATHLAPALLGGAPDAEIDAALAAFDAAWRPAATRAVERNHAQAQRLWEQGLFRDPPAFARAVDPAVAGWGRDPAAAAEEMQTA